MDNIELELNGQGGTDTIPSEDHHIHYDEKKRKSLTLPLLNVVSTNAVPVAHAAASTAVAAAPEADEEFEQSDNNEEATIESDTNEAIADELNKKKKIYESDDAFIQTIFSQTIKSTTATPTDDEPSHHSFEAFVKTTASKLPTSMSSNSETDEPIPVDLNDPASSNDDIDIDALTITKPEEAADEAKAPEPEPEPEPEIATAYTYFHKTIDEDDDSPDLNCENAIKIYSPSNTLTTTTTVFSQSFDRTQSNICIKFKENPSEITHQSFDNSSSLNDKSTASASNDANHDLEHSLTQSYSFDSEDVSVPHLTYHMHSHSHFHFNSLYLYLCVKCVFNCVTNKSIFPSTLT